MCWNIFWQLSSYKYHWTGHPKSIFHNWPLNHLGHKSDCVNTYRGFFPPTRWRGSSEHGVGFRHRVSWPGSQGMSGDPECCRGTYEGRTLLPALGRKLSSLATEAEFPTAMLSHTGHLASAKWRRGRKKRHGGRGGGSEKGVEGLKVDNWGSGGDRGKKERRKEERRRERKWNVNVICAHTFINSHAPIVHFVH